MNRALQYHTNDDNYTALLDQREVGARDVPPPLQGLKFFQFQAIFWGKNWPNNGFSYPPLELAPQPRGNPGSATALGPAYSE